jgi:hypothetical protein
VPRPWNNEKLEIRNSKFEGFGAQGALELDAEIALP